MIAIDNYRSNLPKILCVDDDQSLLGFLDYAFKSEGYETRLVADTSNIMQIVKEWQPDVILLDMAIGESCGLDVAKDLHLSGTACNTPIVFITANDSEDVRYSAFLAGAMDFITKPFTMSELIARINPLTSISKLKRIFNTMGI